MMASKKFYIALIILVGIITLVGCNGNNNNQSGEQQNNIIDQQQGQHDQQNQGNQEQDNTQEKIKVIKGVKTVGKIELSNITIKLIEENKCEVTANVKNTSGDFLNPTNVKIEVLNKKGEVEEVFGGIITSLAGYEPNTFVTYVLKDITNAYDVEFSVIE